MGEMVNLRSVKVCGWIKKAISPGRYVVFVMEKLEVAFIENIDFFTTTSHSPIPSSPLVSPTPEAKPVPSLIRGPPVRSQCLEWLEYPSSSIHRYAESASSNDDKYHGPSKSRTTLLHWFPLANEAVKPISPTTSRNSQLTLCLPPLSLEMSKRRRHPS
ncbi:hypothetical protein BS47DRAFT_1387277 [Hydnum rufescens UP504]|uniref:Uncharacterized protein n=1 Tax=Hydnum rufescens UP504 TaxID=1448309 RepID=A0A9P6BAT1_9AGAM|nr:hypothetical protein BS47DRAFT_1387277 [Hydnum rufescens UP504]